MRYTIYHRMTGERRDTFVRYVDAFNAARSLGPGWAVREL